MMTNPETVDLNKICIRVKIEEKGPQSFSPAHWESLTLQEILDNKEGGQISKWFFGKVMGLVGYEEADTVRPEHVKSMIAFLENNGVTIVKLK